MTSLFIDESKAKGYLIVAAVVLDSDATRLRKKVARLRKPGQQKRVHFVDESNSRRRQILAELGQLGVRARLFYAEGLSDRDARAWCLSQVVELAAALKAQRIVLEMDDSIVESDRRTLFQALRSQGIADDVSYSHDRASAEPLLWLPDAVAWSYSRGGEWSKLVQPLVIDVTTFAS